MAILAMVTTIAVITTIIIMPMPRIVAVASLPEAGL